MQHLSYKYLSQQIYTQEVILNTNTLHVLYMYIVLLSRKHDISQSITMVIDNIFLWQKEYSTLNNQ